MVFLLLVNIIRYKIYGYISAIEVLSEIIASDFAAIWAIIHLVDNTGYITGTKSWRLWSLIYCKDSFILKMFFKIFKIYDMVLGHGIEIS